MPTPLAAGWRCTSSPPRARSSLNAWEPPALRPRSERCPAVTSTRYYTVAAAALASPQLLHLVRGRDDGITFGLRLGDQVAELAEVLALSTSPTPRVLDSTRKDTDRGRSGTFRVTFPSLPLLTHLNTHHSEVWKVREGGTASEVAENVLRAEYALTKTIKRLLEGTPRGFPKPVLNTKPANRRGFLRELNLFES